MKRIPIGALTLALIATVLAGASIAAATAPEPPAEVLPESPAETSPEPPAEVLPGSLLLGSFARIPDV